MKKVFIFLTFITQLNYSCSSNNNKETSNRYIMNVDNNKELITLGAGCFWCVEAIFENLKGVEQVTSGYSGGHVKNPSYKEVCNGTTGHAEVVQLVYNPSEISFLEILEVFFQTHDPTTLNRQGNDVGTQYRSAIFYHTEKQKEQSLKTIELLNKSGSFDNLIVTEVMPFSVFYKAEDYHQDYFELNANENPYCSMVVKPKVDKFKKVFKDKLKEQQ
jgi:peptide-methionine (S)-S-oxide reductase